MNTQPNPRWQEIDELLAYLARKDREWLARERASPSGAPSQALHSVALSGPAAFVALQRLPRDQDPEAWICAAIFALRDAKAEFIRADRNDPDCFGSAIFGQVECELSHLFARWNRRNPQSRFAADQLRLEVLESCDDRMRDWWECRTTAYTTDQVPDEAVRTAFDAMTSVKQLPAPMPAEPGPEYLQRLRAQFQALTVSPNATLATAAAFAVDEVDRVIRPVMEVVAKPRLSPIVEDVGAKALNHADMKFRLFTEVDSDESPMWHGLLRVAVIFGMGAIAAWITVTLVYALRD